MRGTAHSTFPALAALTVAVAIVACLVSRAQAEEPSPAPPDFTKQILPILSAKCVRCHGERQKGGKLEMRSVAAMLAGGNSGPAFKPGNAEKSLMIELIHFKEMPPKKDDGPRVNAEEFELLKAWIDAGGKP